MNPIERLIVGIDSGPWSIIWRAAVGFAIPPMFRALSSGHDSIWVAPALFVGLLVALRAVPMALRHALPFSAEAKAIWAARRGLSKEHDSYAWQKLFWIGLGLVLFAATAGRLQSGEIVVTLFCLIGGGAGLLVWLGTGTFAAMWQGPKSTGLG
jgi:hypothetical protein